MSAIKERFSVVIIGAGVAGLTLANILVRNEISCLVLERNSAIDIEKRQRAGTVEVRAVRMFERWGLGNVVMAGPPYDGVTEFRLDGHRRVFREQLTQDILATPARLCPQQILVRNLIDSLSQTGTHIRFESSDVSLSQLQTSHPIVSYRDAEGMLHEVNCDYVAGCDGFHGISRKSIPDGVLTQHSREFGVAWLNVLADVPPRILMAMGNHGFAAQFPRGPLSRFYLQCSTEDTEEDWPDERIWAELRARLGEDDMLTGPITDRLVFPLRSAVFDPMRYGQLFLVGDAAHIISPVGGKGMNLALFDADTLAQALIDQLKNGDDAGLCQYSDTCLRRTWNYQEFSATLTDTLHASCDTTAEGGFQRHLARARFERMFNSDNAARSYSELIAGML